ncbi:MAG: peptidase M3 [Bacteroidetes bacterium]|nr:peptidase M3 [Bacteroidota bacterium]
MKNALKGLAVLIIGISLLLSFRNPQKEDMNQKLKDFIVKYENQVKDLNRETALAYFNAAVSGSDADYKLAEENQIKLSKIHSNVEDYEVLLQIKESGEIVDELLSRQLTSLYNAFLFSRIDEKKLEEMIMLSTDIEKKYSNFRAIVGEEKLSDNEIERILKEETDSEKLKAVWEAHKNIGFLVAEDVLTLVRVRNEIAQQLEFNNFHEMKLLMSDQNPEDVFKLFNELDDLTRADFIELKGEIDTYLAKKNGISVEELRPWHYQNRFFQEAPSMYDVDLDKYYKGKDIEKLTSSYYAGIGLDITDILANSDLYEKPGKNQHAFCIDIDNEGDVRILCNIKDNSSWMNTMLHEYGHGVYDKYIDRDLPYVLRDPAHTFTTEAIAQMFGRFASNPQWLKDVVGISSKEKRAITEESLNTLRLEQLVFSRWAQVMYRFEKGMYENPDQDLNKLWWDLVEQYQMVTRPDNRQAPDWASKVHIATSPCYYHNYLLGELLASQLYYYITKEIIKSEDYKNQSFANNKAVGDYLLENIFKPGARYYWNDMIEKATGEKLTAKYYAMQFVKNK